MNKFNSQTKIYLLLTVWLVLVLFSVFYGFGLVNSVNQIKLNDIQAKKKEQLELEAEQKSYLSGKADLELLAKKTIQPEDFFSKDTSLVREIRELEAAAKRHSLELNFSIAGTSKVLTKAKTKGELLIAPYSLGLTGNYSGLLGFLKEVEDLNYITYINNINLQTSGANKASLSAGANFFLKP